LVRTVGSPNRDKGAEKDLKKAIYWYIKATENGNGLAHIQ